MKIPEEEVSKRGIFNVMLDWDSLYFVNFLRVKSTTTPVFENSYAKILEFYRKIGILLKASANPDDVFYRKAFTLLEMKEFEEICLGYSAKSTGGSGSGDSLKRTILGTAKAILDAGIDDPEIFQLVGIFEENIGPDRISDHIARIIKEDIYEYTKKCVAEILEIKNCLQPELRNGVIRNPINNKDLLFLPMELLHELPIAREWDDIDHVCSINAEVREKINSEIGLEWEKLNQKDKKKEAKRLILSDANVLRSLIRTYQSYILEEYDFERDPVGDTKWNELSKLISEKYPCDISKPKEPSAKDLFEIVKTICLQYKHLIEDCGLNEILYDSSGKPRKERIAQRSFYSVAYSYCKANDLGINPEVNSGRGAVDFKFNIGFQKKVLVEMKLSSNHLLLHGFETQVREYEKAEQTNESIFFVIKNGDHNSRLDKLLGLELVYKNKGVRMPEILLGDGRIRPSASHV